MSEEVPIELYRKENGEFVKFVRYDDYKKLENIIKEVREYIKEHPCNTWYYAREGKRELVLCQNELLEILDKGE